MARARNIKPGFYRNEDLAECSIWARHLFPGLWMLSDREGRMEDRPKRIRAEILPFDMVDVDPLLADLAVRGFIKRYEVNGKRYIQVLKFLEHQKPHATEKDSVIPDENGFYTVHERTKNNCVTGKSRLINSLALLDNCYVTVKRPLDNALNPSSLNPESCGEQQQSITTQCPETATPKPLGEPEQGHDPPKKNPPSGKTPDPDTASPKTATVDAVSARAVNIAVLLRQHGASIVPGNVRVRHWAETGISDVDLLAALATAERRRVEQGCLQPVNAGLIEAILADAHGPPARASPGGRRAAREAYLADAQAAGRKHGLDSEMEGDSGRDERDISGQCARVA